MNVVSLRAQTWSAADTAPEYFEEVDESFSNPEQALDILNLLRTLQSQSSKSLNAPLILALYYQEEMNLKEIGAILMFPESLTARSSRKPRVS